MNLGHASEERLSFFLFEFLSLSSRGCDLCRILLVDFVLFFFAGATKRFLQTSDRPSDEFYNLQTGSDEARPRGDLCHLQRITAVSLRKIFMKLAEEV